MFVYGDWGIDETSCLGDYPPGWMRAEFREPPQRTPNEIAANLGIQDARAFASVQPFLSRNLARGASINVPLPLWVKFDSGYGDPREKIACYRKAYTKTLFDLAL